MTQLTKKIYVASRDIDIQRAMAINNPARRTKRLMDLSVAGLDVNERIDIEGADPFDEMTRCSAQGFTSIPSVRQGNPFNSSVDPETGRTLPPKAALPNQPGVPGTDLSYQAYLDKNGPFAIVCSVDAADYPANPEQYVPLDLAGYREVVDRVVKLAPTRANYVPLTKGQFFVLPDETDAMDVDEIEDENGLLFPKLDNYALIANEPALIATKRYAVVLNLDGQGPKAYDAQDIKEALDAGQPLESLVR